MYIGWDIGIKNLAYCNLEVVGSSQEKNGTHITLNGITFNIKDWGVINLVDDLATNKISNGEIILTSRPNINCFAPKITKGTFQKDKNGKEVPCNKKAIYCLSKKYNDEYRGLCEAHYKKLALKNLPEINNKPICYYEELNNTTTNITKKCKMKAQWLFKEHLYIGLCTKHKKKYQLDNKIEETTFLKTGKAKKATHINLTTLGMSLYTKMDNKKELLNVDTVLLENQPVLTNPTMKSVQMLLYSYYILKGIKERQNVSDTKEINEIKCYMASKKNSVIKCLPDNIQLEIENKLQNVKSSYTKNKKASMMITSHLVNENPLWGDFYNTHKKKDDLADALLMTIHYILFKKNGNAINSDNDNDNNSEDNIESDSDDNINSDVNIDSDVNIENDNLED